MKILLVPWGRGMGHVIRCFAIAAEAANYAEQEQVTIVVEEQWATLVKKFNCSQKSFPQELTSIGPWDEWDKVDHLQQSLAADLRLLEEVKPDIVLHDRRPTMVIACELTGIPCVMLAQYIDHPDSFYPVRVYPHPFWGNISLAIDVILCKYGLQPLKNDVRDLFYRHHVIIPSIPEFDPLPEDAAEAEVWYIGPLLLNQKGSSSYISAFQKEPKLPVIFVYGVIKDQQDLDQLICVFRNEPFYLLITGLPTDVKLHAQESHSAKISISPFVNIFEILPDCTAAIIHGGHGSCMSMLVTGTPTIVLSGSGEPERTYNGKRLEAMGVAQCISGDIRWDEIVTSTKIVVQEISYRTNAQKWQKRLKQFSGAKSAWEILAKLALRSTNSD